MAEGGLPPNGPVSPTVAEDLLQTATVPINLVKEAVCGVMVEMFPGSQPQQVPEPMTGECQGGVQLYCMASAFWEVSVPEGLT